MQKTVERYRTSREESTWLGFSIERNHCISIVSEECRIENGPESQCYVVPDSMPWVEFARDYRAFQVASRSSNCDSRLIHDYQLNVLSMIEQVPVPVYEKRIW